MAYTDRVIRLLEDVIQDARGLEMTRALQGEFGLAADKNRIAVRAEREIADIEGRAFLNSDLKPGDYVINTGRMPSETQSWVSPVWVGVVQAPDRTEDSGRWSEQHYCDVTGCIPVQYLSTKGLPEFKQLDHANGQRFVRTSLTASVYTSAEGIRAILDAAAQGQEVTIRTVC
jgi:hypothetical protein